jgi:hypothetical protein
VLHAANVQVLTPDISNEAIANIRRSFYRAHNIPNLFVAAPSFMPTDIPSVLIVMYVRHIERQDEQANGTEPKTIDMQVVLARVVGRRMSYLCMPCYYLIRFVL